LIPQDTDRKTLPGGFFKKVHGFADKLRIFMKDFNAIMFPQSEGCLSSKKPEEKKQEDVNEGLPPQPEIKQEIKQEEKPEAKPEAEHEFKAEQAINETEAKIKALAIEEKQNDNLPKKEKENIAKEKSLILPKESAAYEVAETKQTAHTAAAKQPKLKPAIIFILLVLCGVTVFLASKVKTLDEIQQQQSIEIKQLQEKLLAGNGVSAPKKVIIYIPFGNKVTK
jgi:glucan-binding YG repeat protein